MGEVDPVAYLSEGSARIRGLEWVVDDGQRATDPASADPADTDRATYLREWMLVKGLIWHASNILVDALFDDSAILHDRPGAWRDTEVVSQLPARFGDRYTGLFAKMFTAAMIDVTASAANHWRSPPTIAHELATYLLLSFTRAVSRSFGVDLTHDLFAELDAALFQDRDFTILYASDPDAGATARPVHGLEHLDFARWFVPFTDSHVPAPYAATLPCELPPLAPPDAEGEVETPAEADAAEAAEADVDRGEDVEGDASAVEPDAAPEEPAAETADAAEEPGEQEQRPAEDE